MTVEEGESTLDATEVSASARDYLEQRAELRVDEAASALGQCAAAIDHALRAGGTIYLAGNGGSATTASHMAIDLSRAAKSTARYASVRMVSLPAAISAVTAIANDDCYAEVFASQLAGTIAPADVLLSISASGESENLLRAARCAREAGATTVGFVGRCDSSLAALSDIVVAAGSDSYGHVEDLHLSYSHAIVYALCGSEYMRIGG